MDEIDYKQLLNKTPIFPYIYCIECDGIGYVDCGENCPTCNGSGLMKLGDDKFII